jgi:hypothetical protein
VFGWKVQKWNGPVDYWLVITGPEDQPGINGAIKHRSDHGTTYNTIEVPSVDQFLLKIEEEGGSMAMPKTAIPGVGYHAYCRDTEGNLFGIMESNTSAR